jgi:hypothetical protein
MKDKLPPIEPSIGKTINLKEEAEAIELARQKLLEESREGCLIGISKLVVYGVLTVPVSMDISDGRWDNLAYVGVYAALTWGLWIGKGGIVGEFSKSVQKAHDAHKLKRNKLH